jgi:hypothetical protein
MTTRWRGGVSRRLSQSEARKKARDHSPKNKPKMFLASKVGIEYIHGVRDASVKSGACSESGRKPSFWPFNNAMPRGSHRKHARNFTVERPFLCPSRIGCVSVGSDWQPSTETTVFFECFRRLFPMELERLTVSRRRSLIAVGHGAGRFLKIRQRTATLTDESIQGARWSSRLRPVTRLQATGEPLKGDARREKRLVLGSEGTDTPDCAHTTGKALPSTKGTEVLKEPIVPHSKVLTRVLLNKCFIHPTN